MKKIRLIELFSGIGSQATALTRLGYDFERNNYNNEQLIDKLYNLGISTDGKKPLSKDQIKRKSESWKRTVFNNFKATNNIGSIVNAKGKDLEIIDTDIYTYLLTYSFPCQDLSVAGKGKGMAKGSGTRSGMLWEVERLLTETENLPQILLMENVPQVHSKKNITDFEKWIQFLESKGYKNFWKDLNSKDYNVAQNRSRTFMVSLLDQSFFNFPNPIELTKTMRDYLELKVDDKYYINNDKTKALIKKLFINGDLT